MPTDGITLGASAAADQADGVLRGPEHGIDRQRHRPHLLQRVDQLVDRRLAELGESRMGRAALRVQLAPAARRACPSASRLSVGSPLTRNRVDPGATVRRRSSRRRCPAPRRRRTAGRRASRRRARSRSAAATCATRMPFASHDSAAVDADRPRRGSGKTAARSRSASRRRRPASPSRREDVERARRRRAARSRRSRARSQSSASHRRTSPSRRSSNRCRPAARQRESSV